MLDKKAKITIPGPIEGVEFRNGQVQIEVNLEGGWGRLAEFLIEQACDVAGQPEKVAPLKDLLMAKEPNHKLVRT